MHIWRGGVWHVEITDRGLLKEYKPIPIILESKLGFWNKRPILAKRVKPNGDVFLRMSNDGHTPYELASWSEARKGYYDIMFMWHINPFYHNTTFDPTGDHNVEGFLQTVNINPYFYETKNDVVWECCYIVKSGFNLKLYAPCSGLPEGGIDISRPRALIKTVVIPVWGGAS